MKRLSGKSLGIVVAVLVVAGLALYAASAGQHSVSPAAGLPADATPAATSAGAAVSGFSGATLVGLLLKVGIVALLLGASLWLLRRYAGAANRAGGRTGAIQIVDTISLAQNRAFYVLDIGDRAVVVGATPQQFSVLAEVSDADVLTRLRAGPERSEPPFAALSKQIGALWQHSVAPAASPPRRGRAGGGQRQPAANAPATASFAATLAAVAEKESAGAETADRLRALTERLSAPPDPAQ